MADELVGRWVAAEQGVILNLKEDGSSTTPGLTGWRRGSEEGTLELLSGEEVLDTLKILEVQESSMRLDPGGLELERTEQLSREAMVGSWRFKVDREDAVENVYTFGADGKGNLARDGESTGEFDWKLEGEMIQVGFDGSPEFQIVAMRQEEQALWLFFPEPSPGQPPLVRFERVS